MALSVPNEYQERLSSSLLVPRDFIRLTVRDRQTDAPYSEGYWSDVGDITATVVDPDTGSPVGHLFHGANELIEIDPIPRVSNLTVQSINVYLNQVHVKINNLLRFYDPKLGRVTIWRGLMGPNWRFASPAQLRFDGFIDSPEFMTPKEGSFGYAVLSCKSRTAELTRGNPSTRSDEDQRARSANDNFFQDVAVVGEWQGNWGGEDLEIGK